MSDTVRRMNYHRQGAAVTTALGATPPTDGAIAKYAAPSHTAGVYIEKRSGLATSFRVQGTRAGADAAARFGVWGWNRSYVDSAGARQSDGRWTFIEPLNNGNEVNPDTRAINSIAVIEHTANGFRYEETMDIGAHYERVVCLPTEISANTSILVEVGIETEE